MSISNRRYRKRERKGKTGKKQEKAGQSSHHESGQILTTNTQQVCKVCLFYIQKSWKHSNNPGKITILEQAPPSPYNHKAATAQPLPLFSPVTGFKNPVAARKQVITNQSVFAAISGLKSKHNFSSTPFGSIHQLVADVT